MDGAGNLYIADTRNQQVRKVSGGTDLDAHAVEQQRVAYLPFGVAVDAAGNVYVAEFGGNRVSRIDIGGRSYHYCAGNGVAGYSGDGGAATSAMLKSPQGVAVDAAGNVYIADTGNNRVRVVSGGTDPHIRRQRRRRVRARWRRPPSTPVGNPVAVASIDAGSVYISDGSARVRKVFSNGLIATVAGSGTQRIFRRWRRGRKCHAERPSALAVGADGNVYVADTNNNAVRVLQPQAGGIAINAIVNGASNLAGAIAPGEVVVLYGTSGRRADAVPVGIERPVPHGRGGHQRLLPPGAGVVHVGQSGGRDRAVRNQRIAGAGFGGI